MKLLMIIFIIAWIMFIAKVVFLPIMDFLGIYRWVVRNFVFDVCQNISLHTQEFTINRRTQRVYEPELDEDTWIFDGYDILHKDYIIRKSSFELKDRTIKLRRSEVRLINKTIDQLNDTKEKKRKDKLYYQSLQELLDEHAKEVT